jgi:hypothetical protein
MRTSSGLWWPKPEAGDMVWCQFPHLPELEPGPKPRPALVLGVIERQPHYRVVVAYGTSQKASTLRRGEFVMRMDGSAAFKLSGLSFDTKFSFADAVELDYSDHRFKVPPGTATGISPKLGVLHAVYGKAAHAAYLAVHP